MVNLQFNAINNVIINFYASVGRALRHVWFVSILGVCICVRVCHSGGKQQKCTAALCHTVKSNNAKNEI